MRELDGAEKVDGASGASGGYSDCTGHLERNLLLMLEEITNVTQNPAVGVAWSICKWWRREAS